MEETVVNRLSTEEADLLVLEHRNWAEGVARSVARAWNLDWQMDGLDGAAMEALIFCSRRFDPTRAIPFRGYARKRIHEASSEAARKSKGWVSRSSYEKGSLEEKARELSLGILNIFPELRSGELPGGEDSGDFESNSRAGIRNLLLGATVAAATQNASSSSPEEVLDYKRIIEVLATLEPIHQEIMWQVYWEGESMRTVASSWETDELNVIREHKVILTHLSKSIATQRSLEAPRVRPGLKAHAVKIEKSKKAGMFRQLISKGT
jgi:DNA-directed RNA polymerase specialized sigma subunit